VGKPAPDFVLPTLHEPGRQVALGDLRGAPFLLNVWGSWCPACRDEHPVIAQLARSGALRVVGFNWRDERPEAIRWLQQFGDPYHLIVVDEVGQTAIDWGVYGAPETFLVDASGIIRWKHVGPLTPAVVENGLRPRLAELGVRL
jgi:cytochrome c biogenesis protein CcmG, thiol:disulfide interchange protein DsbE